jgi:hypothetical protein
MAYAGPYEANDERSRKPDHDEAGDEGECACGMFHVVMCFLARR